MPTRPTIDASHLRDPLRPRNPLVAHRWILIGIGIMVVASVFAVYFALGLLFWQGQWQLIFHPSHVVANTPASAGTAFEDVRFDTTETGQPRLDGWWVPASAATQNQTTILYLHDARGSLSDALPDILALRALGCNVFAFDPRGFGKSEWAKPSEQQWNEDADAQFEYVTGLRHIPPRQIVLVGRRLGATVAANLAGRHRDVSRLVMLDPQPPTLALLEAPRWTRILPVRLLARDRFEPTAAALKSTSLPKLFLVPANASVPSYVMNAAQPATIVYSTSLEDAQSAASLHAFIEDPHGSAH